MSAERGAYQLEIATQISLPMATIDGLPLGLSLIGARHCDRALIALARRVMA